MGRSPRLRDEDLTGHIKYSCSVLRGTAEVLVERRYCVHEEERDTHARWDTVLDCATKQECDAYDPLNLLPGDAFSGWRGKCAAVLELKGRTAVLAEVESEEPDV